MAHCRHQASRLEIVPLRSVDTPVANSPLDATAREPPRSVIHARVPPWRILRRFFMIQHWIVEDDSCWTNGVLLLNVKLEVDASRTGCGDAKLGLALDK